MVSDQKVCDVVRKALVSIEGIRIPSRLLFYYQEVCDMVSDQKVCDVVWLSKCRTAKRHLTLFI